MLAVRHRLALDVPFAVAALAALSACNGGGSGGSAASEGESSVFQVASFDEAGRTDVARNQPLTFTFSAPIDRDSVSVDGLQVRSGNDVVQGRIEVDGNTLRFFPTVLPGDRDDTVRADAPPINALGFSASTRFSVVALANSPFSLRSRRGSSLAQPLRAQFTTSARFAVEFPSVPPHFVGAPTFDPLPIAPGGDLFGDPSDSASLPLLDPTNVSFTVRFSEPMDPGRFSALTTFTLTNVTPRDAGASCEVPSLGQPLLGAIESSGDSTQFTFRALLSLGDRPDTTEPFVFRVAVSPSLTDLSGNPLADADGELLAAPLVFHFATRDKPGEPNYQIVSEGFDHAIPADAIDPANAHPALWVGNGVLEGAPVTRRTVAVEGVEAAPCPIYCLLPQPLTPTGNRLQMLYYRSDFNFPNGQPPEPASIIGMSWRPPTISNFLVAATYPRVTLRLGHSLLTVGDPNGLSFVFDDNYAGFGPNNPTTVYDGSYSVPNLLNVGYFPWPAFTRPFEYSGQSSIVWEANVDPGGGNIQAFRYASSNFTPHRRIFDVPGARRDTMTSPTGGENTHYFQQFVLAQKRSRIVSPFYDTGVSHPDYSGPLVVSDPTRGTPCSGEPSTTPCFRVTWEGADPDGVGRPNLRTSTGFSDAIDDADGRRFIRFAVQLDGDPFSSVVPAIDAISFAFRTCGGT
ncbi:MAG: hypothetical protein HYR85_25515 [Planctomycetes bacterium]|nr:hypothetical protein [Planctomycetota bacterium]MBI3845044.1 hypothetical protein [Planctomycetota bacterium]